MKFLLGEKEKMSQIFAEDGTVIPVTIIKTSPMSVVQIKTKESDGYYAVQVGFGLKSEKNQNKSQRGHLKDLSSFRYLREFRLTPEEVSAFSRGQELEISFAEGDKVFVSSISKGKGFQGVVKRHGFAGGRRSHGQKHSEREPGSIGATGPQRVMKGKKMGGRMGSDRVTVKNLSIAKILPEEGLIMIKGAVPGRTGTLVELRDK